MSILQQTISLADYYSIAICYLEGSIDGYVGWGSWEYT
jgi:hypothetical protein